MPNLPSGPGQNDAQHSLSVVLASGHAALPVSLSGGDVTVDIDASNLATHADALAAQASLTSVDAKLTTLDTNVKRLAPLGPGPGSATASASKIFGFAYAANAAGNFDLTSAAVYGGLKTAIDAGKLLMLKSTTGCFYNWATANITILAAATAANNPASQGVPMFDGGESPERAPPGTTVLNILGGPVAGILYVYIAE